MQYFSIQTEIQVSYEALLDILSVAFLQGACGSWATISPAPSYAEATNILWSNTNKENVEQALVNVHHPQWELSIKDFQTNTINHIKVQDLVNSIQTIADKFPAHFHMIKNNNITPELAEMVIQYAIFSTVKY